MIDLSSNTAAIKQKALDLGFNAVGVVPISEFDRQLQDFYYSWLAKQYHGTMHYLEKNAAQRFDAQMLLPDAQSALVVLAAYNHGMPKFKSRFKISRYAVGLDYHFVIKQRLHQLLAYIRDLEPQSEGRAFTDSAPVPERYLAQKAGLGFIGKNGMLIHPRLGSYVFIGELYLNAKMQYDWPLQGYSCGDCNICTEACPKKSIVAPAEIDSRKCISYQTIEYKGVLQKEPHLAGYIFGCDICQQVCPFNKNAPKASWPEFEAKPEVTALTDADWHEMGSSRFKRIFGNTVMARTGLRRLRRNIKARQSLK